MSMTTLPVEEPTTQPVVPGVVVAISDATDARHNPIGDFIDLIKPRISAMVLVTVALTIFVASEGAPSVSLLMHCLVGTALVAASSGAFNQLLERETDSLMERTASRPLPAGRMGGSEVVTFGLVTLAAGVVYLVATVGWHPSLWAIATWVVYVAIYTPMKRRTSWNTTVGAIAGAMPILIGWSAVGGPLTLPVATMFLVLFLWQFPHFIAIAWIYRRQYAGAGLQMVTTTDPTGRSAGMYSALGAALLLAGSLLPMWAGFSPWYALVAGGLGFYQLRAAIRFRRSLNQSQNPLSEGRLPSDLAARGLLKASIIYLPLALGLIAVHTAL